MCDTYQDAANVASIWNESYHDFAHRDGKPGYYNHFHPDHAPNHPHIWYYGSPPVGFND